MTGPRNLRGNHNEAYEKFYKVVMEYVCVMGGMELALQDETAGAEVCTATIACMDGCMNTCIGILHVPHVACAWILYTGNSNRHA